MLISSCILVQHDFQIMRAYSYLFAEFLVWSRCTLYYGIALDFRSENAPVAYFLTNCKSTYESAVKFYFFINI